MFPHVPTEASFNLTYSLSYPYKSRIEKRGYGLLKFHLNYNISFHTLPLPNPGPYQTPFPGIRFRKLP